LLADKGLLVCCGGGDDRAALIYEWPGIRLCAWRIPTHFAPKKVYADLRRLGVGKILVNPHPTNNIRHHFRRWLVGAPVWRCGGRFTMTTAVRFAKRADGYRVEFRLPFVSRPACAQLWNAPKTH
jgi:hypothetical protein